MSGAQSIPPVVCRVRARSGVHAGVCRRRAGDGRGPASRESQRDDGTGDAGRGASRRSRRGAGAVPPRTEVRGYVHGFWAISPSAKAADGIAGRSCVCSNLASP